MYKKLIATRRNNNHDLMIIEKSENEVLAPSKTICFVSDEDCEAELFFTSDTHFNQERSFDLSLRKRMFSSMAMSSIYMKSKIMETYGKSILFHLGDVGNKTKIYEQHEKSYLILGNYEERDMKESGKDFNIFSRKFIDDYGFKDVYQNGIFLDIRSYGGLDSDTKMLFLTHDPYYFIENYDEILEESGVDNPTELKCLYGHIHGRQMVKHFGIDVGVDAHFFTPISMKDADFFLNSLDKGFYDHSVWGDIPNR